MTKVNINDLELILSGAKAIQNGETFHKEVERLRDSGKGELPMTAVYEMAETFGIQNEAVDKFMELRFPSKERQLETLTNLNAKPRGEVVIQTYETNLLNKLRENLPTSSFEAMRVNDDHKKHGLSIFYELKKRGKGIFGIKVERIELAIIHYNWVPKTLIIKEPLFAQICQEEILKLQKKFKDCEGNVFSISYEYNPHLEE